MTSPPGQPRRPRRAYFAPVLISGAVALLVSGMLASCAEKRLYPVRALDASLGATPDVATPDGAIDRPVFDAPTELPPGFVCPLPAVIGFAATGAGTTGGGGAPPVTVTTEKDLITYANTDDAPQVINIPNVITLTADVRVKSNKTIRGTGAGAGLTGWGLYLKDSQNVIVQNLTITLAKIDAIAVEHAQNIWVDHCDLSTELDSMKGTYDGLVDITHASINVTVSWTRFHDHYNPSLVGHSKDNALEDTGALTVTYHHNWFRNTPNQCPRVRFGKVHVFNSYYQTRIDAAIVSVSNADLFVEGNYFEDVARPILTVYPEGEDKVDGKAFEMNNRFDANHPPHIVMTSTWRPTYAYQDHVHPTELVPAIVTKCAGPTP